MELKCLIVNRGEMNVETSPEGIRLGGLNAIYRKESSTQRRRCECGVVFINLKKSENGFRGRSKYIESKFGLGIVIHNLRIRLGKLNLRNHLHKRNEPLQRFHQEWERSKRGRWTYF